jgi:hypothetical protein
MTLGLPLIWLSPAGQGRIPGADQKSAAETKFNKCFLRLGYSAAQKIELRSHRRTAISLTETLTLDFSRTSGVQFIVRDNQHGDVCDSKSLPIVDPWLRAFHANISPYFLNGLSKRDPIADGRSLGGSLRAPSDRLRWPPVTR